MKKNLLPVIPKDKKNEERIKRVDEIGTHLTFIKSAIDAVFTSQENELIEEMDKETIPCLLNEAMTRVDAVQSLVNQYVK